ncbi:MAG: peptidoglycan DD-metalloendopeptidase family protein, partial [Candidatus Paceibacterota bacterium]
MKSHTVLTRTITLLCILALTSSSAPFAYGWSSSSASNPGEAGGKGQNSGAPGAQNGVGDGCGGCEGNTAPSVGQSGQSAPDDGSRGGPSGGTSAPSGEGSGGNWGWGRGAGEGSGGTGQSQPAEESMWSGVRSAVGGLMDAIGIGNSSGNSEAQQSALDTAKSALDSTVSALSNALGFGDDETAPQGDPANINTLSQPGFVSQPAIDIADTFSHTPTYGTAAPVSWGFADDDTAATYSDPLGNTLSIDPMTGGGTVVGSNGDIQGYVSSDEVAGMISSEGTFNTITSNEPAHSFDNDYTNALSASDVGNLGIGTGRGSISDTPTDSTISSPTDTTQQEQEHTTFEMPSLGAFLGYFGPAFDQPQAPLSSVVTNPTEDDAYQPPQSFVDQVAEYSRAREVADLTVQQNALESQKEAQEAAITYTNSLEWGNVTQADRAAVTATQAQLDAVNATIESRIDPTTENRAVASVQQDKANAVNSIADQMAAAEAKGDAATVGQKAQELSTTIDSYNSTVQTARQSFENAAEELSRHEDAARAEVRGVVVDVTPTAIAYDNNESALTTKSMKDQAVDQMIGWFGIPPEVAIGIADVYGTTLSVIAPVADAIGYAMDAFDYNNIAQETAPAITGAFGSDGPAAGNASPAAQSGTNDGSVDGDLGEFGGPGPDVTDSIQADLAAMDADRAAEVMGGTRDIGDYSRTPEQQAQRNALVGQLDDLENHAERTARNQPQPTVYEQAIAARNQSIKSGVVTLAVAAVTAAVGTAALGAVTRGLARSAIEKSAVSALPGTASARFGTNAIPNARFGGATLPDTTVTLGTRAQTAANIAPENISISGTGVGRAGTVSTAQTPATVGSLPNTAVAVAPENLSIAARGSGRLDGSVGRVERSFTFNPVSGRVTVMSEKSVPNVTIGRAAPRTDTVQVARDLANARAAAARTADDVVETAPQTTAARPADDAVTIGRPASTGNAPAARTGVQASANAAVTVTPGRRAISAVLATAELLSATPRMAVNIADDIARTAVVRSADDLATAPNLTTRTAGNLSDGTARTLTTAPEPINYRTSFNYNTRTTEQTPVFLSVRTDQTMTGAYRSVADPISTVEARALGVGPALSTAERSALGKAAAGELSPETRGEITASGGDPSKMSDVAKQEVAGVFGVVETRAKARDITIDKEVDRNNGRTWDYSSVGDGSAGRNYAETPATKDAYDRVAREYEGGTLSDNTRVDAPLIDDWSDHFYNPEAVDDPKTPQREVEPYWYRDLGNTEHIAYNPTTKNYHVYGNSNVMFPESELPPLAQPDEPITVPAIEPAEPAVTAVEPESIFDRTLTALTGPVNRAAEAFDQLLGRGAPRSPAQQTTEPAAGTQTEAPARAAATGAGADAPAASRVNPVTGGMLYGNSPGVGPRTRIGKNGPYQGFHAGSDIYPANLKTDRTVLSVSDGTVVKVRTNSSGYGQYIEIKDSNTGIISRYAHIGFAPGLEVGSTVKAGQTIGKVTGAGTDFGKRAAAIQADTGVDADAAYNMAVDEFTKNGWGMTTPPHLHYEERTVVGALFGNGLVNSTKTLGYEYGVVYAAGAPAGTTVADVETAVASAETASEPSTASVAPAEEPATGSTGGAGTTAGSVEQPVVVAGGNPGSAPAVQIDPVPGMPPTNLGTVGPGRPAQPEKPRSGFISALAVAGAFIAEFALTAFGLGDQADMIEQFATLPDTGTLTDNRTTPTGPTSPGGGGTPGGGGPGGGSDGPAFSDDLVMVPVATSSLSYEPDETVHVVAQVDEQGDTYFDIEGLSYKDLFRDVPESAKTDGEITLNENGKVAYSDGMYAPSTENPSVTEGVLYEYRIQQIQNGVVVAEETQTDLNNSEILNAWYGAELYTYTLDDVLSVSYKYIDPDTTIPDNEYYEYTITLTDGTVHSFAIPRLTTVDFYISQLANTGYTGDVVALTEQGVEVGRTELTPPPTLFERLIDSIKNGVGRVTALLTGDEVPREQYTEFSELSSDLGRTAAEDRTLNTDRIKAVYVYIDVPAPCAADADAPVYVYEMIIDVPGVTKDGVLYNAVCGSGNAISYANAIAGDVSSRGYFTSLTGESILDKLLFRFYDKRTGPGATEEIPNTTNEVVLEAKVTRYGGTVTEWATGTLDVREGDQLHLRWNAENYQRCLPFIADNG